MESPKPIRGKSLRAAVLAIVTVVAVLVAPVCAPLCAARACEKVSSAPSNKKCHGMNMANQNDPHLDGHSVKPCSRIDLPAVTLSSFKSTPKVFDRRNASAEPKIAAHVAAVGYWTQGLGWPASRGGGLEKLGESCSAFSILRI